MERHISTLSILHYVYGAFICLSGTVALIFIFAGSLMSSDLVAGSGNEPPPEWLGSLLQGFGIGVFLIELFGVLNILSGLWIAKRRNRIDSMVVAAFNCLSFPFGMALGIFTFVVLADDNVKRQYPLSAPAPAH